jgi:hypothetical protein
MVTMAEILSVREYTLNTAPVPLLSTALSPTAIFVPATPAAEMPAVLEGASVTRLTPALCWLSARRAAMAETEVTYTVAASGAVLTAARLYVIARFLIARLWALPPEMPATAAAVVTVESRETAAMVVLAAGLTAAGFT